MAAHLAINSSYREYPFFALGCLITGDFVSVDRLGAICYYYQNKGSGEYGLNLLTNLPNHTMFVG